MSKRSTPATSIDSTLELIWICERTREIMRGNGVDEYTASVMRLCPWYELQYDPIVWAIYKRGWQDWTADVTHIYNAPSLTSLTTATSLQPIKGTEYGTERYVGEFGELVQRSRVIMESQGGERNAMARIAVIASTFSVAKIRSDPILWAVYTRAWEDRAAVENTNRILQPHPSYPADSNTSNRYTA